MIVTSRLDLVPATPESIQAALESPAQLRSALDATVPPTWPPEFLDPPALEYALARLREGERHAGWWLYFIILREAPGRAVIGSAGYKGPPSPEGHVEIGYGIVADRHRQGFGSEAAGALIANAFAQPTVTAVFAETYPELVGSIGVINRCGFRLEGPGTEPRVLRYRLDRPRV